MGVEPIGSVEISRLCEVRKEETEEEGVKVLKSTRSCELTRGGRLPLLDVEEEFVEAAPVGADGPNVDELVCRFRVGVVVASSSP